MKRVTSPQSENSGIKTGQTSDAPVLDAEDMAALESSCPADFVPVVARLRASLTQYREGEQRRGTAAGKRWAEETAEAIELQRLADSHTCVRLDSMTSPYTSAEDAFFILCPEMKGDHAAAVTFWTAITGRRFAPEQVFVESFVESAVKVWDEAEWWL